jgi:hypothetical protein
MLVDEVVTGVGVIDVVGGLVVDVEVVVVDTGTHYFTINTPYRALNIYHLLVNNLKYYQYILSFQF